MTNELMPCPFCGGEAELLHDTHSDYESQWTYTASCRSWRSGEGSCNGSIGHFCEEKNAIKAWNARAPHATTDDVERVAELMYEQTEKTVLDEYKLPWGHLIIDHKNLWRTRAESICLAIAAMGQGGENEICEVCGGDGKETCDNQDHGFIVGVGGEIGRLGCPVCGHDENHKVPNGDECEACNGTGYTQATSPVEQATKEFIEAFGIWRNVYTIYAPGCARETYVYNEMHKAWSALQQLTKEGE